MLSNMVAYFAGMKYFYCAFNKSSTFDIGFCNVVTGKVVEEVPNLNEDVKVVKEDSGKKRKIVQVVDDSVEIPLILEETSSDVDSNDSLHSTEKENYVLIKVIMVSMYD